MKLKLNYPKTTELSLEISVEPKEMQKYMSQILQSLAKSVSVPGFRLGKAPAEILERHVDPKRLVDEFIDRVVNDLYKKIVNDQDLTPADNPKVSIKKFVPYSIFDFEISVLVARVVELGNYRSVKVPMRSITVDAKEVDEVIEGLAQRSASKIKSAKPAKLGDEVLIDFSAEDKNGNPIDGASGKSVRLILGSKNFIPGFEEKLVGQSAGGQTIFTIVFPGDYGAKHLAGAEARFNVKLLQVNELQTPKLTDEFASKVGPFKKIGELKQDIKKQLLADKRAREQDRRIAELVEKITDSSKVAVPESLVQRQAEYDEEDEKQSLSKQGQSWEQHLKAEGITEKEHMDRKKIQALQRLKSNLVLREITRREKLQVSDDELRTRLAILKSQHVDQEAQKQLEKVEVIADIKNRLLTEKTLHKIIDYVDKN